MLFPTDSGFVPPIVTANQHTVAIQVPSRPVAKVLIADANIFIAAPSANSSGKPGPTRANNVVRDLNGKTMLILDGGPCEVGL